MTSPFSWRDQPPKVNVKKLDQHKRQQMGTALSAWKRGSAGNWPIRPIDKPGVAAVYRTKLQ